MESFLPCSGDVVARVCPLGDEGPLLGVVQKMTVIATENDSIKAPIDDMGGVIPLQLQIEATQISPLIVGLDNVLSPPGLR